MNSGGNKSRKGQCLVARFASNKLPSVILAVFIFGILLILLNLYELRVLQNDHAVFHGGGAAVVAREGDKVGTNRPVLWVYASHADSGYLQHVFAVFRRAGYDLVYSISPPEGSSGVTDRPWDVLWAHDYPFGALKDKLINLKPHQRVNHFPGSGYITNKVQLVTSKLRHTPKAFKMPDEKESLVKHAKANPELLWVQKSSDHRGVHIRNFEQLDLAQEGTFIQQYIHDPYLIGGHRFDIGIYVVLLSVAPLRVYMYQGDWLIRFCSEEYYPFNPENVNKYVVTDDYLPIWKVPELNHYYNTLEYTMKETIFAKLREDGHDPEKLSQGIQQAIREVYLAKEANIIESLRSYKSKRNFFEMVRFDFVLDKELNVYLMEVNMSPNLSSGHFWPNRLLYEQVVYNMLSVTGVVRDTVNTWDNSDSDDELNMWVSSRDIRIYSDVCGTEVCHENCAKQICNLCGECMKQQEVEEYKRAFQEHQNRKAFRRVFPGSYKNQEEAEVLRPESSDGFFNLTQSHQRMWRWFHGKCLQDPTWCS